MRKKNKLSGLIVAMILCMTSVVSQCMPVLGSGTPRVIGGTVEGKAGETVTVDVSLQNNPGITSITLDFDYDPDMMTLVKVDNMGLLPGAAFVTSPTVETRPYRTIWNIGISDTDVNGTLAQLTFQINDGAKAGNYPVTISYAPDDIYNTELTNITFEVTNINVTIKEKEVPPTETPAPQPPKDSETPAPQPPKDSETPAPQPPKDSETPAPQSPKDSETPAPQSPKDSETPAPQSPKDSETPAPQSPKNSDAPVSSGGNSKTPASSNKTSSTAASGSSNGQTSDKGTTSAAKTSDNAALGSLFVLMAASGTVIVLARKKRVNS